MSDESSFWSDGIEHDIISDLEALRQLGLIEVVGITDDGQWLYAITDQGREFFHSTQVEAREKMDQLYGQSIRDLFPNEDE